MWLSDLPDALARFTSWGISDHCASILTPSTDFRRSIKPFQFYNHWVDHPDFKNIILEAWSIPVSGHPMFIFNQKLKEVRRRLACLKKSDGTINDQISAVRSKLCSIQESILGGNIQSSSLLDEKNLNSQLWDLLSRAESIAKQCSRIQWLNLGDNNTAFFYKKMASNWNQNKIMSLLDQNGNIYAS